MGGSLKGWLPSLRKKDALLITGGISISLPQYRNLDQAARPLANGGDPRQPYQNLNEWKVSSLETGLYSVKTVQKE